MVFVFSWFPHVLSIVFEELYGKSIIPHVIPLMACKSTLVLTPLMVYLFDRRLHLNYLGSNTKDLTIETYSLNNDVRKLNINLLKHF